jgi:hypothetical protein
LGSTRPREAICTILLWPSSAKAQNSDEGPAAEGTPGLGPHAPSQVSAQDIESARAAIFVLIIAGIMIFWRFLLRVLLAIIVVAAGLGLFVLLQNIHR